MNRFTPEHHKEYQVQKCDEELGLDNSTAHWMGRCTLVSWITDRNLKYTTSDKNRQNKDQLMGNSEDSKHGHQSNYNQLLDKMIRKIEETALPGTLLEEPENPTPEQIEVEKERERVNHLTIQRRIQSAQELNAYLEHCEDLGELIIR